MSGQLFPSGLCKLRSWILTQGWSGVYRLRLCLPSISLISSYSIRYVNKHVTGVPLPWWRIGHVSCSVSYGSSWNLVAVSSAMLHVTCGQRCRTPSWPELYSLNYTWYRVYLRRVLFEEVWYMHAYPLIICEGSMSGVFNLHYWLNITFYVMFCSNLR